MAITAVVGAGVAGAAGSVMAGQAQAGASKKATAAEMAMYQQTRSDLQPYMQGGNQAFSQLQALMGMGPGGSAGQLSALRNTPGYQFALEQGQEGLDRSSSARGMMLSGGQLKDSMQYNQGMADNLFNNTFNQYSSMSQLGEDAAAKTGNAGTAAANAAGNNAIAAGQAQAGAIGGVANSIGSTLGTLNGMGALSDRRAKENIVRIGRLDSGLPVYSYNLKGSDLPTIGVMADEVRTVAPHAVRRAPDGYDRVDYGKVSRLPAMRMAA